MRTPAILALLLCGAAARADIPPRPLPSNGFDPSPFPHRRDIASPVPQPGLFRIEIDPDLHHHAGKGFGSIRLVNARGETPVEIPWIARRAHVPEPGRPAGRLAHLVDSFEETPDGAIEITVSLQTFSNVPASLDIVTPLRDFEKGVVVSIPSPDGGWNELVKDGVIFDHTRFLDFRHTEIPLPHTPAQRFRIRIADATDEQRSLVNEITRTVGDASGLTLSESGTVATRVFRIDELRFLTAPTKAKRDETGREGHTLAILESSTDEKGVSSYLLDAGNLPLDRLVLSTGDRNFRRAVSVKIPEGPENDPWRTAHRGHVHRYEVGNFRDESLVLTFSELRTERLRLLVENGSNAPLAIQGLTGQGPAYEIVFLAEAGDRPAFYLGAKTEAPSSLDTAAIEAALRRDVKAETLALAALAANPGFATPAVPPAPGILESPVALWAAIALAVAVLIWVLYRALRKIEGETPSVD